MSQYLNFVMDMAYSTDNFSYWSATLGNSRVMEGYSHQLSSLSAAITSTMASKSGEGRYHGVRGEREQVVHGSDFCGAHWGRRNYTTRRI